jgi:hypothetical protein
MIWVKNTDAALVRPQGSLEEEILFSREKTKLKTK